MKAFILVLLILPIIPQIVSAQKTKHATFKRLKKVSCDGVDENSSEKKQLQCLLIDVVKDSANYFPSMSQKSDSIISSPEMAWNELKVLYPDIKDYNITCWTEYSGYYIFSLDCGMSRKRGLCAFVCMLYVPINGSEFWYFVPRT